MKSQVTSRSSDVSPQPRNDNDEADARRAVHGRVRRFLHLYHLPAPQEAVGRDEHARIAVAQPAGDRVTRVAREDGRVDRADRGHGERGDGALGRQWQKDSHAITGFDPECAEAGGAAPHRGVQLAVGESPRRALLALEDDRRARRIVAQRRCDEVHSAAEPPGGPGDAAGRIEHAVVRLLPNQSEVTLHCAPEALQIFDGPAVQRGKILVAVGRGELTQPAAREVALGGGPGEHHSNEPSFGVVL